MSFFIIGDWNAKVGSQEIPRVTGTFGLGVQNEAGQRLIEFCQKNALVIANTLFQQHKRRLYTWTSSDGQHWNQIEYILCSQRWRSSIQPAKTRLGASVVTEPFCQSSGCFQFDLFPVTMPSWWACAGRWARGHPPLPSWSPSLFLPVFNSEVVTISLEILHNHNGCTICHCSWNILRYIVKSLSRKFSS